MEFKVGPVDLFLFVFILFLCEHMVVKMLLEFFISEVNVELFKRIFLKNFEAEYV